MRGRAPQEDNVPGPSQGRAAGTTLGEKQRTQQPEELLPRSLAARHNPAPAASEFPPRQVPE